MSFLLTSIMGFRFLQPDHLIQYYLGMSSRIKHFLHQCLIYTHIFAICKSNTYALESSYNFGHDSNISDNMIISKYLDIEAIDSDTSISCDESWNAFVFVNLFAFEWPSLCFTFWYYSFWLIGWSDSNTCLFAKTCLH